jgi:hypothetical protein
MARSKVQKTAWHEWGKWKAIRPDAVELTEGLASSKLRESNFTMPYLQRATSTTDSLCKPNDCLQAWTIFLTFKHARLSI